MDVRIEERTVRRLGEVRVAVGNVWRSSRAQGQPPEPSALVFVGEEAPVRVWVGDEVLADGLSWRVLSIETGPRTTGQITLGHPRP